MANFNYKKWTIAMIVIGILIRFVLASIYTVAGDACWQFSASRFFAENNKFPLFEPLGRQEPFWPPPLFHIIVAFFYKIFGIFNAAEFGMKMVSPLMGTLTLIVIYLISRKLFDEKITFYSMIFSTFIPILMDYHIFGYIDGTMTFFTVLAIYFALDGKYIKSAVSAGLCALTKYNGIFVMPLLIYLTYNNTKERKQLIKKILVMLLIPFLIASPWFLRNYIHFGNPFWPFVNFAFHGLKTGDFEGADFHTFETFELSRIFDIRTITFTYLAIFGVPDGDYKNIFFFDIPHIKILFTVWLLATFIFILPFARSFPIKNKTTRNILLLWILPYMLVSLLYIANVSYVSTRFFLPAMPAIAMLYGIGFSRINLKAKASLFFHVLIFAIIIGFVATEAVKISLASREWAFYKENFEWVKQNTAKNAIIIPGRHCLSYHLNRGTLDPKIENLKKADYIWVNLNFNLERRAIIPSDFLEIVKENNYEKVYENKNTGTSIYKVKKSSING